MYPHNKRAYEKAVRMLEESGKAAIVHPTGTGKSFIGFCLAWEHEKEKICWLHRANISMKRSWKT